MYFMYFNTNVFHRCLKMRRLSVILTLNTSSAICLLVKDSSLLGTNTKELSEVWHISTDKKIIRRPDSIFVTSCGKQIAIFL